ncbi:MAG: biotin/lipoyl-binding protein, partial [Gammaproteobacteria bacterium]|nr:biotin/lipoyl-binding protein [Gammaproteobacteria bacterium]
MAYVPQQQKKSFWWNIVYFTLGALVSIWYGLKSLAISNKSRFKGLPDKVKAVKKDFPQRMSTTQTEISRKVNNLYSDLPQYIEKSHSTFKQRLEESRVDIDKYLAVFQSWFPTQAEEKERQIIYSRSKQEDTDFMPDSTAAVLEDAPIKGRFILNAIVVFFLIALVWSIFADLDEITRGVGTVIPSQQVQIIQNLEGGILKEINIKEGDVVEAGQVLLSLDDTRFSSSLRENQLKYLALKAKAARLQAEAEGVEFVAPIDVL